MDADLDSLRAGIAAAQEGRVAEARHHFAEALRCRPDRALTWIWSASVAPSRQVALSQIARALALEPENAKALEWRRRLEPPPAPVEERKTTPPTEKRPAVLVVDDSSTVRAVLVKALEPGGYRTLAVASGGEALALLEREQVDALLLDITMPDLDGITVCRTLRRRGLRLPILMVTGDARPADIERCRLAGANACLKKPIGSALLLEVLGRQLKAARQAQSVAQRPVAQQPLSPDRPAATQPSASPAPAGP